MDRNVNPFANKHVDLRPFGMPNILPQGGETAEQDPFCGEIPDDARGYTAYRRFYEQKMDDMIGGAKTMSLHANCAIQLPSGREGSMREQKPEHMGAGIVMACNHVIYQDPHNPEGIKFYPLSRGRAAGFYLCKSCMRLEERHRLDFGTAISMKCAKCVLEAVMKLHEQHPDRLINLAAL